MDLDDAINVIEDAHCAPDSELCDISAILGALKLSENIIVNMEWLDFVTQQKLFKRISPQSTDKKERWDADIPDWMNDHGEELLALARNLGLMSAIAPSRSDWDAAAVLGATGIELHKRMDYIVKLLNSTVLKTDTIFLLVGERFITQDEAGFNREGGREHLQGLADSCGIARNAITESYIAADIAVQKFSELDFSVVNWNCGITMPQDVEGKKIFIIDTPKGDKFRPNTQDTVSAFLAYTSLHKIPLTSVLYFSRNPNILAQKDQVSSIMQEQAKLIDFEVVGGGCEVDEVKLHKQQNGNVKDSAIGGSYPKEATKKGAAALQVLLPLAGYFHSAMSKARAVLLSHVKVKGGPTHALNDEL